MAVHMMPGVRGATGGAAPGGWQVAQAKPDPAATAPSDPDFARRAAQSLSKLTRSGGGYNGEKRRFVGRITGFMIIPDLEGAIKFFTGDDPRFGQLPKVVSHQYQRNEDGSGTLTYYFQGKTYNLLVVTVEIGALGYRIITSVDRSRIDAGVVRINWKLAKEQPRSRPDGKDLVYFDRDDGSWTLERVPGPNPPLYKVTWSCVTVTNEDSLPTGSGLLPEGLINSAAWEDVVATFRGAQRILNPAPHSSLSTP